LVMGTAFIMGRTQAIQPFCESCDDWMGREKGIGVLPIDKAAEGQRLAQAGMYRPLGEMLLDAVHIQTGFPFVTVSVQKCEKCTSSDARLAFRQVTYDKKKQAQTRNMIQGMISPSQLSDLNYGLRMRPTAGVQPSSTPRIGS
ncbi:MAG TPA: hypothetical protein VFF78_08100, partial [Anaerolineaceae bacterium]|nr:hypothetical protein [Anaerolineaceae bacterium]